MYYTHWSKITYFCVTEMQCVLHQSRKYVGKRVLIWYVWFNILVSHISNSIMRAPQSSNYNNNKSFNELYLVSRSLWYSILTRRSIYNEFSFLFFHLVFILYFFAYAYCILSLIRNSTCSRCQYFCFIYEFFFKQQQKIKCKTLQLSN